jgi:hypothetical protein
MCHFNGKMFFAEVTQLRILRWYNNSMEESLEISNNMCMHSFIHPLTAFLEIYPVDVLQPHKNAFAEAYSLKNNICNGKLLETTEMSIHRSLFK